MPVLDARGVLIDASSSDGDEEQMKAAHVDRARLPLERSQRLPEIYRRKSTQRCREIGRFDLKVPMFAMHLRMV
jgi:hypothetical protein